MKVAIVGTSTTSRDQAPYGDETWEIWTLNDMFKVAPRIDRYFDLHQVDVIKADPKEWEWLTQNETLPVWMHYPTSEVPMALQYPTEVIVKEFGRYFTNSVSWMIALAVYQGADEIGLWGVDMAHGTEYAAQRPSCEYMIGVAVGRGIPVYIPATSDLLKCAELYGLERSEFLTNLESRIGDVTTQRDSWRNRKTEAMLNEAKADGAIEMLSYVKAAWTQETR